MTHRAIASSLLLLGLCAAACSLLTNPEQGEIRCKVSDEAPRVDPCPEGMYCINKTCKQQPECKRDEDGKVKNVELCEDDIDNDCDDRVDERDDQVGEKCDGDDNDCDGLTDENFDADKDGWTTCGEDGFFTEGKHDCNSDNASVHPEAPEICDGLNNDCDENTDESTPGKELCEGGQLCVRGACLKPSCALPEANKPCGPGEECIDEMCVARNCQPPCKASEFCQQQPVPTCMPIPRRALGEGCTTDADCDSNLQCIGRDALRLPSAATRGVCSRVCCKDADCTGPDESCFVSGSGTRACMPRKVAFNSGSGGTKPVTCSVIEDCPTPQICAPMTLTSSTSATAVGTVCRAPAAMDRKYASACAGSVGFGGSGHQTCASRMCVEGNYFQELCTTPCRSTKDCLPLKEAARVPFSITPDPATYCAYRDLAEYSITFARNYGPVCFVTKADIESRPPGAECREDRQCADNVCVGASSEGPGRCAPVCCNDTQCTQIRPDMRCRPLVRGTGRYEMRCLQ